jgi:hypothetical protein
MSCAISDGTTRKFAIEVPNEAPPEAVPVAEITPLLSICTFCPAENKLRSAAVAINI